MNSNKKGFIPVMLTPFKENGSVDFYALTSLVEYYLSAGASGLFANCLSSEMFELSPEERLMVTEHVVKVNRGRVPVVATATFGGEIKDQAEFIKRMSGTGIDAAIVITNMLIDKSVSDEDFESKAYELLKYTGDIPLGFYECPVPYKKLLSHKQLLEFVKTGRVIYHKDTSLDIEQVRLKVEGSKINPTFGLYDAYMVHAVESLMAGSAGLSCIQGNYFPELIVWLCDNYNDQGKQEEVHIVQQFLINNMEVMHQGYPKVAKIMVKHRIPNFPIKVRRGDLNLNRELSDNLNNLWAEYRELMTKIS